MAKRFPKLRFREFNSDWKVEPASNIFENSKAKGHVGLPVYSVTLDRGMVPRVLVERTLISETTEDESLLVSKGDISYNMMRMWQGAFGVSREDCVVSPAYVVLHPKKYMFVDFFIELFNRDRSIYLFTAFSYGITSDRLRLYFKDFAQIKFTIPQHAEQQKIASFLSTVGEKIQHLKRKKQLLEHYKKGVMQQMFSGKLRFKDGKGREYPKWEEKKLGELGSTYSGLSGKRKVDFGTGKPYIQYKQILDSSKVIIENSGYVRIHPNENQARVQYGDVFFTTSSETPNEIGFASVLLDNVPEMYLNSFCFGYRPHSIIDFSPEFARYLFRSEPFRSSIIKLAQGSTRYNMSKQEFMKIKILLPCKTEQQRIAGYLSTLDVKIELVGCQIAQAQTFKKGLLQQMFV